VTRYGCLPKTPDARDFTFAAPQPWTGEHVDLSGAFPQAPYDQGQLGSCVAQGTAAILDYARVKQGLQPLDPPSRLFIYYCGRVRSGQPIDQDTGLQVRDGLTVAAKDGAPPELDWPYDIARFADRPPALAYDIAATDQAVAYGSVPHGGIDAAIAAGYPVVFGFTVYSSFEDQRTAATGVMPVPAGNEQVLGGHCVVACSTQLPGTYIPGANPALLYRLVRNSWGHDGSWGLPSKPGYFWMPTVVMDGGDSSDFWTLTHVEDPNVPTPPTPTPPQPDPGPVAPFPAALVAAAQAAAGDPAVVTWLHRHHVGTAAEVAARLRAVLAAPRA